MTENNLEFTRRRALMHHRRAIMRIRESSRTRVLEKLGIARTPTRLRIIKMVPTTKLVGTESLTPTLTTHHRTVAWRRPELQGSGAGGQEVSPASHDGAVALALVRGDRHGDVVAVDEADAVGGEVGVAVVEGELGEGGRGGAAGAGALEAATAVAGGAGEAVAGVGAVGAGPDPARPVLGRSGKGPVGEFFEGEAAALEDGVAGVGLDGGPDGEGAVVDHG